MAGFRLAAAAKDDILAILAWTEEHFGDIARRRDQILHATGLRDIAADPGLAGSVVRSELGDGVGCYHLRHSRERAAALGGFVKRPRHLLVYRLTDPGLVGVGRVLHDSMEFARHRLRSFGAE